MQILDFQWFDKLGDSSTSMFVKRKAMAEEEVQLLMLLKNKLTQITNTTNVSSLTSFTWLKIGWL
jgi:hypothetical protein